MNNNLIVEVKDNGKGFDLKNLSSGIGINNIKERAKTINADLIILTIPIIFLSSLEW